MATELDDWRRVDLGTKTMYCLLCGKVEPFEVGPTIEFLAKIDAFNEAHKNCGNK